MTIKIMMTVYWYTV